MSDVPAQPFDQHGTPSDGRTENRRRHFRVLGTELVVRGWRMDAHERLIDRPLPSRRVTLMTVDMGRGGAGVFFNAGSVDAAPIHVGERLRVELPNLRDPDAVTLIEARVIYLCTVDAATVRVGVEFRPALTETLARRLDNALDKLLAQLQRDQLRKARDAAA